METVPKHESILMRLAAEAVRLGADLLEVEYKDGFEEVFAAKGGVGQGIARYLSSSPEAATLREELHRIARRKQRIAVGGAQYELRGSVYHSFGEDAFRVELRRVQGGQEGDGRPQQETAHTARPEEQN